MAKNINMRRLFHFTAFMPSITTRFSSQSIGASASPGRGSIADEKSSRSAARIGAASSSSSTASPTTCTSWWSDAGITRACAGGLTLYTHRVIGLSLASLSTSQGNSGCVQKRTQQQGRQTSIERQHVIRQCETPQTLDAPSPPRPCQATAREAGQCTSNGSEHGVTRSHRQCCSAIRVRRNCFCQPAILLS